MKHNTPHEWTLDDDVLLNSGYLDFVLDMEAPEPCGEFSLELSPDELIEKLRDDFRRESE